MIKKLQKILLIGLTLISINACAKSSISIADTSEKIVYQLKTTANNPINSYEINEYNTPETTVYDGRIIEEFIKRIFRKIFGF